jgi:hypothetical protein
VARTVESNPTPYARPLLVARLEARNERRSQGFVVGDEGPGKGFAPIRRDVEVVWRSCELTVGQVNALAFDAIVEVVTLGQGCLQDFAAEQLVEQVRWFSATKSMTMQLLCDLSQTAWPITCDATNFAPGGCNRVREHAMLLEVLAAGRGEGLSTPIADRSHARRRSSSVGPTRHARA